MATSKSWGIDTMARINGYPESVQAGLPKLAKTPEGWETAPLGKYLKEVRRPVKLEDATQYRLVTVKRSRGGVVEREHLAGKDIKVKTQFRLSSGDFLISKRQIVHGACGIVPEELEGTIVSNEYAVLHSSKAFFLPFLTYLAESTYFQQTCFHSSIGVHIEKMLFKLDRWFNWKFNIPPLEEQKRIVALLSTWDRAITTVEKSIENNRRQKQALLNSLVEGTFRLKGFGKPATGKGLPKDWKTISLGQLGRCITGLTYSPADVVDDGGLLVLRSSNIADNEIALGDNVYVTTPVPEETLTKIGDILVAVRNGSRNLIGKNAVIGASAAGMAHGAFMTLYRSEENYYLSHLFQSEMFTRQVNRNLGATINSINISNMNKFKFPFPPKEERDAIASVLSASSREISALRKYLTCLRSEKHALLRQLLSGELRVNVNDAAAPVAVNG